MRSHFSPRRAALVTALVLGSATLACGGDGNGTDPDPVDRVGNVAVSPSSAEIEIGETQQFTAVVTNQDGEPMNEPVSWSSSNTAAATVNQSSGLATGVGGGQTTISATADGVTGTATLTVVDPNPPEAPSDVVAVPVADDAIEVGWTDNSDNETGFLIEREEVTSGAAGSVAGVFAEVGQVGANVTTFRDEGLDPSTSYRYRVLACNDNGCTGGEDGDGTTTDDVTTHEELVMDTQSLPDGVTGTPYAVTLQASGGDGMSYVWTVEAGSLPDGLALSEDGELTGTPTETGTFTFTLRVTSVEQTVDREFTVEVTDQIFAPEVSTDDLPGGVTGDAYQAALQATKGDGTYAWALVGGALPDGLQLASDGTISGTPTTAGTFTFTVEVASAGMTGSKQLSITVVEKLEITTTALSDGFVNTAYSAQLAGTGGTAPLEWTLDSGSLPDGLSLSTGGAITGTPTTEGTFDFTVRLSSADGQEATADLSITINTQIEAPEVTTSSLANGVVGAAYNAALTASKGDGTYAWAIISGALPAGLALAADGTISGTPTTPGTFNFTVEVTSAGMTGSRALSITVNAPLEITTTSLATGVVGDAYNASVTATGGGGGNTFSLDGGALPDGLAMDASGTISGTPTAAGTSNFTVKVESDDGQSDTQALSITIHAVVEVTTTTLPDGETGAAYSASLAATGGDGTYTWAVTSGSLPGGVVLAAGTGALTGTPTASGTFNFTVEVTSGDGQTDSQALSITINPGAPVVTTTSLPDGQVGVAYNESLQASGGDGSYSWAVVSGSLPDGLSLAADGTISGTPGTANTFNFTVEVTSAGQTDSQALSITITAAGAAVTIETTLMAPTVANAAYERTLVASGGDGANYTWTVDSGTFPPGFSLDGSTGTITGPPTTPGTYTFTVKAESAGQSDTQELTIDIVASQSGFQFTLFYVTSVPADVMAEVEDAAARWSAIITADVPDVRTPVGGLPDGFCDGFGPLWNGTSHDDIGVIMNIISIDGVGGTLASAGHCGFLRGTGIPFTGNMKLDLDDLNGFLDGTQAGRDQLEDVIFHEMGHVLGLGTRWDENEEMTGKGTTNPEYLLSGANSEFQTLGGSGNVDIENDGGQGTADGHWEESASGARDVQYENANPGDSRQALDDEIMTGFVESKGTNNPVSKITIAAVGDLGYTVDLGASEAYSLPTAPNDGGMGIVAEEEGQIAYGDDIYRSPALYLLPDGRIRMVLPDGRVRFLPRPRANR